MPDKCPIDVCEEKFNNILEKLKDLHDEVKETRKDLKNGITKEITEIKAVAAATTTRLDSVAAVVGWAAGILGALIIAGLVYHFFKE